MGFRGSPVDARSSLPRHSRPLCAHSNLRFSGPRRVESGRPDFVRPYVVCRYRVGPSCAARAWGRFWGNFGSSDTHLPHLPSLAHHRQQRLTVGWMDHLNSAGSSAAADPESAGGPACNRRCDLHQGSRAGSPVDHDFRRLPLTPGWNRYGNRRDRPVAPDHLCSIHTRDRFAVESNRVRPACRSLD